MPHSIATMLQYGSILLLECFLGGNSLLLHYSRRAALPSEPRIFSAEDNTQFVQLFNDVGTAHFPCHVGLSYNALVFQNPDSSAPIGLQVSNEITGNSDFQKMQLASFSED